MFFPTADGRNEITDVDKTLTGDMWFEAQGRRWGHDREGGYVKFGSRELHRGEGSGRAWLS